MSGGSVQQVAPSFTIGEPGVGPGASATPCNVTLTAAQPVAQLNFNTQPTGTIQISHLQTLKIDNSVGPIPLVITFPDTGDQINVQPYEYGYYPCHTNSLTFIIAAPLLPSLQWLGAPTNLTVRMQALNYYVAPQTAKATSYSGDAGYTIQLNSAGNPWNVLTAPVPGPAGAVLTTIYSTNFDTIGFSLYVQGSSIDGANWTVLLKPATLAEYNIPPTAAGSPLAFFAFLPPSNGGRTKTTGMPAMTFRTYPLGLPPVEAVGTLGTFSSGAITGGPGFIPIANNTTVGNPQTSVKLEYAFIAINQPGLIVIELAEFQSTTVSSLSQIIGTPANAPVQHVQLGPFEWFSSGLGWSLGLDTTVAIAPGNLDVTLGLRFTAALQLAHV